MTKLKTLKDIVEDSGKGGVYSALKQEAIKWAKKYSKERDNAKDLIDCANADGKLYALEIFFNITEEDLK